jgi:nitroimidazol reductase NimA-like FMN-containing flavoprotein (pyridoxamine 5'-phosphate oxidase superfamily)
MEGIRHKISSILENQLYGVLATSNKNQPYTSLLAFVVSDDIRYIYLATGRDTNKFQNLSKNQKVAFFVDTRNNNKYDISNANTLTAIAQAESINEELISNIEKTYIERHPDLASFIKSKNVELIQLKIISYTLIEKFQSAITLKMYDDFQ